MRNISESHSVRLPEDNFFEFNEDMGKKGIIRQAPSLQPLGGSDFLPMALPLRDCRFASIPLIG